LCLLMFFCSSSWPKLVKYLFFFVFLTLTFLWVASAPFISVFRRHSNCTHSLTHSILINLFIKVGSPAKYCFCPRVFTIKAFYITCTPWDFRQENWLLSLEFRPTLVNLLIKSTFRNKVKKLLLDVFQCEDESLQTDKKVL